MDKLLKKILKIIKKIIFSMFLLYGYNLIMAPLNMMIPINIITIALITILGSSALLGLISILLVIF